MSSADSNREGKHAIALSLTRQSVEALTLIECDLLKDRITLIGIGFIMGSRYQKSGSYQKN